MMNHMSLIPSSLNFSRSKNFILSDEYFLFQADSRSSPAYFYWSSFSSSFSMSSWFFSSNVIIWSRSALCLVRSYFSLFLAKSSCFVSLSIFILFLFICCSIYSISSWFVSSSAIDFSSSFSYSVLHYFAACFIFLNSPACTFSPYLYSI